MKPTSASTLKHKHGTCYRFTMRGEQLNIMNMRGYGS